MKYKGFLFPQDLHLFFYSVYKVFYYLYMTKKLSPEELLGHLTNDSMKFQANNYQQSIEYMTKISRLVNFILVKILHYTKPCLVRSCILFKESSKRMMSAEIFIAVKKEGETLKGHSWISIEGNPFLENSESLKEYTVMMKGQVNEK